MTALEVADPSLRFVALGDSTSLGIGDVRPAPRPGGWAARLCEALDAAQPLCGWILATLGELRSVGATVLVATLPSPGRAVPLPGAVQRVMAARIESINAAYVELAREHGALLLDLANHPGAAQRQSWHIDRIHPGVAGHLILAEGFAELLRDVGYRVGPLERTEPAPVEARQQIGWLLRHGTPWLAKRSIDLVPTLTWLVARQAVHDRVPISRSAPP